MTGNVGIGTWIPSQMLDVQGTVKATSFSGDGSGLTGISGGASGWTLGASNVGISTTNNVGIGTNLTTTAGLSVMSGNVGIGTWKPTASLMISKGGTALAGTTLGTTFLINSGELGTTQGNSLILANFGFTASNTTSLAIRANRTAAGSAWTTAGVTLGVDVDNTQNAMGGYIDFSYTGGLSIREGVAIYTGTLVNAASGIEKNLTVTKNAKANIPTTAMAVGIDGASGAGYSTYAGYFNNASSVSGGALAYGIYSIGANNYFSGNVGVGTGTPQGAFVVTNGNVGIGTWAPHSNFNVLGSQAGGYVSVTSNTTLNASHYLVFVDSTGGAVTITLPTAVGIGGRCYRIKDWKGQAATNPINIATTSSQTIDGASGQVIGLNYQELDFCSDNANWSIF